MGWRGWSLIAGALVGLLAAGAARAGDSEVNRLSLKGIPALRVLVEMREPEEDWKGLTRAQVRAEVAERLRRA